MHAHSLKLLLDNYIKRRIFLLTCLYIGCWALPVQVGYPILAKAGKVLHSLVTQSTGANGSELPGMDSHSPRSCASDPCSVSSLSTSPESTPMRARPGAESPSATSAVQVKLLSAEDAHAPLVAAARQGRILQSNADPAASDGHPKRASLASSPLPSKLLATKANGQKAGVSSKQSSGSGSALIPARPPSRMAAAVAVAKAESSGDLMGFLSMLAARQTGSKALWNSAHAMTAACRCRLIPAGTISPTAVTESAAKQARPASHWAMVQTCPAELPRPRGRQDPAVQFPAAAWT